MGICSDLRYPGEEHWFDCWIDWINGFGVCDEVDVWMVFLVCYVPEHCCISVMMADWHNGYDKQRRYGHVVSIRQRFEVVVVQLYFGRRFMYY